jgi:hypothetical protein
VEGEILKSCKLGLDLLIRVHQGLECGQLNHTLQTLLNADPGESDSHLQTPSSRAGAN